MFPSGQSSCGPSLPKLLSGYRIPDLNDLGPNNFKDFLAIVIINVDDYQVSSGVAVSCLYVMVGVARAARRSLVSRSSSMDLRLRR